MRKICIFILLFVLIFTGCLPTPTEEVVIHKNEGTLEQQLSATAAPAYQITIGSWVWGAVKGQSNVLCSHLTNFIKAAEDLGVKKLVIAGGVSANSLLRRTLADECQKRGWQFYMPEKSLCGDNAAMVGSQGYYEFLSGRRAGTDLNAYATMSIEETEPLC